MKGFTYCVQVAFLLIVIAGCAGENKSRGILEPAQDNAEANLPPETTTQSPSVQKLMNLLQNLGYEGVGLQYESEDTQTLLYRIFSDERSARRQIRLVYTGMIMAYDPKHQSLTVGGGQSQAAILAFIQKSVPLRPAPAAAPAPGAPVSAPH